MQCSGKQTLQHQGSALLLLPETLGVEPKASCKPGKFYAPSPLFRLYSETASLSCHIDLEPAIFPSGSPDNLGQQSYTTRSREGSRCTEWQGPCLLHGNLPGISPPVFSVCHRLHPSSSVVSLARRDLQVLSPQLQEN